MRIKNLKSNITILLVLAVVLGITSIKTLINLPLSIDRILLLQEGNAYKLGVFIGMSIKISGGIFYIYLFFRHLINKRIKSYTK